MPEYIYEVFKAPHLNNAHFITRIDIFLIDEDDKDIYDVYDYCEYLDKNGCFAKWEYERSECFQFKTLREVLSLFGKKYSFYKTKRKPRLCLPNQFLFRLITTEKSNKNDS